MSLRILLDADPGQGFVHHDDGPADVAIELGQHGGQGLVVEQGSTPMAGSRARPITAVLLTEARLDYRRVYFVVVFRRIAQVAEKSAIGWRDPVFPALIQQLARVQKSAIETTVAPVARVILGKASKFRQSAGLHKECRPLGSLFEETTRPTCRFPDHKVGHRDVRPCGEHWLG